MNKLTRTFENPHDDGTKMDARHVAALMALVNRAGGEEIIPDVEMMGRFRVSLGPHPGGTAVRTLPIKDGN